MLHTHMHKHSDCKHCILSVERQEIFVYNLGSQKHLLLTLSRVLTRVILFKGLFHAFFTWFNASLT